MTMMIASPFMSFATEEGSLDTSGTGSEVSAPGDDAGENNAAEDAKTEKSSADSTSDGSYTCVVSGIRSGIIYDLPVKIVDAGGKTVSKAK